MCHYYSMTMKVMKYNESGNYVYYYWNDILCGNASPMSFNAVTHPDGIANVA